MLQILQDLFRIAPGHWTDYLFYGAGAIAVIALGIQIYFYVGYFLKVSRYRQPDRNTPAEPVTVIICANNEAVNLRNHLPLILEQDYPEYQVVVVNDGSLDDTATVLKEFQKEYKHLYTTHIDRNHPYPHTRKLAQTVGIKAAQHDLLLFIDISCKPAGTGWIRAMQSNFRPGTDIVLGYASHGRLRGFAAKLIGMDHLWIGLRYLSFALNGIPCTGDGRNLAYRKSLFFDVKGFANQLHLQSSGDDLFINQTSTRDNTAIEISPEGMTACESVPSLKFWLRDRRKQLKTQIHFKRGHRFLFGLEAFSRVVFFVAATVLLSFWKLPGYVMILVLLRLIMHLWIMKLCIRKLKEKGLWLFSLVYEILMPLLSALILLRIRLRNEKKFTW